MGCNCISARFLRAGVTATLLAGLIFNGGSYLYMRNDLTKAQEEMGPRYAYGYAKSYSENFYEQGALVQLFAYGSKMAADKFKEGKDEFGPYDASIDI